MTTEIISWKDIAPQIREAAPALAKLIDAIDPGDQYPLIKATYLFGDSILKEGKLQLPHTLGNPLPLDHKNLDPILHENLSYSSIPLGIILNNESEVFLEEAPRTIPLNILGPGQLFGTFELIDFMLKEESCPIWNMTAGLRSVFMLPKINEASGLKRLRARYLLPSDIQIKSLWDHWSVFKAIARDTSSTPWKSDIIFFSRPWFSQRNKPNEKWSHFYDYFFQHAWKQAQYAIHEFKFGYFWQKCINTISMRNLKPSAYAINTIKHLWAIATGVAPGFRMVDSPSSVPLLALQQAFIEFYRLENYWPTIMGGIASENINHPLYYSLAMPTLFYGPIASDQAPSLMAELRMIQVIMDVLRKGLSDLPIIQNTEFE